MDVGILTIIDNDNYGNRLQNYATQVVLQRLVPNVVTIRNDAYTNTKNYYALRVIKRIISKSQSVNIARLKNFLYFNRNIIFSKKKVTAYSKVKKYDYVLTGSDQVWNPSFGRLREVDLLTFVEGKKRIAFAASFGINDIPNGLKKKVGKELKKFKAISVREDRAKEIVVELTGREDVTVLVDPTMLLTPNDWDKVIKKPSGLKSKKFILNYFLGELSDNRKKEIEKIAKNNGCEIINILDKNSPYYECGPSEFLYLEKNAFLICTDSFHSSVFAILYSRPFLVFDREDNHINMNSRLETLLEKFKLESRKYSGKIEEKDLKCDYRQSYKILEEERQKARKFLIQALNLKDSEINE